MAKKSESKIPDINQAIQELIKGNIPEAILSLGILDSDGDFSIDGALSALSAIEKSGLSEDLGEKIAAPIANILFGVWGGLSKNEKLKKNLRAVDNGRAAQAKRKFDAYTQAGFKHDQAWQLLLDDRKTDRTKAAARLGAAKISVDKDGKNDSSSQAEILGRIVGDNINRF